MSSGTDFFPETQFGNYRLPPEVVFYFCSERPFQMECSVEISLPFAKFSGSSPPSIEK